MKKSLFLLIIIFLVGIINVYPQTSTEKKFRLPRFSIETTGGYSLSLFDLEGSSHLDFYRFKNYSQNDGFTTMVKGNFCLGKVSKTTTMDLYLILGYNHYQTSENIAYDVGTFNPPWPKNFVTPGRIPGQSYLRINLPYAAFGAEYKVFLDNYFITNFAWGLGITASDITGRIINTPLNGNETFNTFHGNFRMGVSAHMQFSHRFNQIVGFVLGTRFDINNLILKSTWESDSNAWMYLNDEAKTALNPLITSDRTIGSVSFYGGISFYLGTKK
ncbi:MAG: hypothetical protein JW917_08790 [Ignavibacteria bacterium]|nr:hypothetical protein [Ignavibacteria bacterium]